MSRGPRGQRGAIAVIAGLVLLMLLVIAGIVVDVGYMLLTRTRLQTFADAAALACANANLRSANSCTSATGTDSTLIQAINSHGDAVTMTVPVACTASGQSNCVQATATSTRGTFFMRLIGRPSVTVSAIAKAGSATGSPCVVALGRSTDGKKNFTVSGGSIVNAPGCAVQSNAAWSVTGGSTQVNAGQINYVDTYRCDGTCAPNGTQTPAQTDPFASLTVPTFPAYTCASSACNSCSGATCTFQPGTYTDGLTVSGGGNATFLPGNYHIQNRKLTISASAANGSGVSFYLSSGSTLTISSGSSVVNFSAPAGGMLIWQAASVTGDSTISGGGNTTLNGSIYIPRAKLTLSGGSDGMDLGTVVAGQVTVSGGSSMNFSSTVVGGSGRPRPVLVE